MNIEPFQVVLLELQSYCNRTCFFCPRQGDKSGLRFAADGHPVRSAMSTEHALNALDQLEAMGFTGRISFHHLSEPFLDPRLLWLASEAAVRGMQPYEHTNGDYLAGRPDLWKYTGIFKYIVMGIYEDMPEEQLEAKKQWWCDRLPTEVKFNTLSRVYPRTDVADDSRLIRKKEIYAGPCSRPDLRMIIHYNGNMALCCEDMAESFGLGNVFETSVKECWHSAKHVGLLADLKAGRRTGQCTRCALPPTRD